MSDCDLPIDTRFNRCAVCRHAVEVLIDLPALPLTDTYCWHPVVKAPLGIDQHLLFCPSCGHGQLESALSAAVLYGENYGFRTSASATARKGTAFFLNLLEDVAPGRSFRCVLDLGCNDLYLLDQLKNRAIHRIGVDPVWRNHEDERIDKDIHLLGTGIEEVDLAKLPEKPDLVVCRHALEHIANPVEVVRALLAHTAADALFVFEVPGFDALLERFRFDQIFHQHLHYFSLASFLRMIDFVGCRCLLHRMNYHDWGAMAIAFERGRTGNSVPQAHIWTETDIQMRYQLFRKQTRNVGRMLASFANEPCYGYGAAQMLPVIAYHLDNDLGQLVAIIDDDPAKNGLRYRNLPVSVILPKSVDEWNKVTVLITAPDNVEPIMTRCLALRPRHLISIFNII